MNCPKCGKENKDGAQLCEFCESPLSQSSPVEEKVDVRTSRLAIASLLLALLSSFAWLAAHMPINLSVEFFFIWLFAGLLAVITGIVSAIRIGLSGGRVTGIGLAAIGIAIPLFVFFFIGGLVVLRSFGCSTDRMSCGTNLSGIGKAMSIYTNDYDDLFPRAGGPHTTWSAKINDWKAADRFRAFNLQPDGSGGQASISSSLYLLVKYAEVKPKSFICKRDTGTTEWKLSGEKLSRPDFELIDAWDFGTEPQKHCSYSYHIPYGRFALTTSGDPGMAVAADRNPWTDSPFAKAKNFSRFKPDIPPWNGTREEARHGNVITHQEDGQTVLFLDGHASFEKRPFCGVQDDNIYTSWDGQDRIRGVPPVLGSQPADKQDSLLVNDPWVAPAKSRRTWWGWRR